MGCLAAVLAAAAAVTGCQKKEAQVIIYSNADDEAVEAMKHALDGNGYGEIFIPDRLAPRSWEANCWQKGRISRLTW